MTARPTVRAPQLEALEPRRLLSTWFVSTPVDISDGNYADGEVSLREAVELANAAPGRDTIRFKSDTGGSELASNITITDDLTIEGIDENGVRRGFGLSSEIWGGYGDLVIDDGDDSTVISVVIDGMRSGPSSLRDGVAIVSKESLAFLNGRMGTEFEHADFYDDATIRHASTTPDAHLIIRNSSFRTLDFTAVTSTGRGSVTIEATEFYWCREGAVSIQGADAVTVVNSTFSNNIGGRAGGLFLDVPGTTAIVSNCTFIANKAWFDDPPKAGGIYVEAGTLRLNSTIVAWNYHYEDEFRLSEVVLGSGATLNLDGSRNNLILDPATAAGIIDGENGNIVGEIPRLAPLADNGGPTRTHALLKNSPAIDAGNNDLGLEFDQRGRAREVGPPDIGAYERYAAAFVVDSLGDTDDGDYSAGNFTLREAIALTSATPELDIIAFDPALAGKTILISSPLIIAGPLSLRGLSADLITLDAGGLTSILSINHGDFDSAPIEVAISNLRLVNSFGSAIYNAEDLILERVEILNCVAGPGTHAGAAIYSTGPVDIRHSRLSANIAEVSGGAIHSVAALTITKSIFSGNSAGEDGGAIWSRAPATITECTFEANTAGARGGAIFVPGAQLASLTVDDSTFSGNSAATGGAIHAERVALEIAASSFNGNSASEDGGAIAGYGSISDSAFDGNIAGRDGGAIHHAAEDKTQRITASTFRDNHAGAAGGAISAPRLDGSGSTFLRNSAAYGGAVRVHDVLILSSCLFEANTATGSGGALAREIGFTGAISDSTFHANTAGADGGAIVSHGRLDISFSMFSANQALRAGAIFNRGDLVIDTSTLTANAAFGSGGALFNLGDTGATLEIFRSTLDSNSAGADGGALWSSGHVLIGNSTLSANAADGSGGALEITGSLTSVAFSTFAHNRADADGDADGRGGALHIGAAAEPVLTVSTIYALNVRGFSSDTPDEIHASGGGRLDPASEHNLIADAGTAAGLVHGDRGNIIGADPLLGSLQDNGGPTPTHAIEGHSPVIDAASANPPSTDQRGVPRPAGSAADIGAFEWGSLTAHDGALIDADSNPAGLHDIVVWSIDGEWIVFRGRSTGQGEQWSASFPTAADDAPTPTGNAVLWIDPATGHTHVAGPTEAGFVLYTRDASGQWTQRNLSDELNVAADSPTRALTQLLTPAGLALVAGYNDAGEIVAFHQITSGGQRIWTFTNISDDLASQGMTTPAMTDLVGYATPWNALNIAGIDGNGDIQVAWIHPATFTTWRIDNLSDRTGAPPLAGQLTVTQTSWHAVNIGGLDSRGHVMITWWVPAHGTQWITSNLTAASDGPALAGGHLTGFVTPWGAINYAGTTEDGVITAYWWTSTTGWQADGLLATQSPQPTGPLSSHVSADGAISILGASDDNQIMRLWWSPHTNNAWLLSNLSLLATT